MSADAPQLEALPYLALLEETGRWHGVRLDGVCIGDPCSEVNEDGDGWGGGNDGSRGGIESKGGGGGRGDGEGKGGGRGRQDVGDARHTAGDVLAAADVHPTADGVAADTADATTGANAATWADGAAAGASGEMLFPDVQELHALWAEGAFSHGRPTLGGRTFFSSPSGSLRVQQAGRWNRSEGPDFLEAEAELNGRRLRGDLVLTVKAQDWAELGGHDSELFSRVALHLVMQTPPPGWFTRDVHGREIPVFQLPESFLFQAGGRRLASPRWQEQRRAAPLGEVPLPWLIAFLRSVAAYRLLHRRQQFQEQVERVGERQAWFLCLAETLGYRLNKRPMRLLAQRAPLETLGQNPEALLFGTAGFLTPVLPDRAEEASRLHHRQLWDVWWPMQEKQALQGRRTLPWRYAPLRPSNHPHRRVAALAMAASRWEECEPLLHAGESTRLVRFLTSLSHPYWDVHCSLPSAKSARRMALVGQDRAQDFLINHVYAQEKSPEAWRSYLALTTRQVPSRIEHLATMLCGLRGDVRGLLNSCFVQQALLQLESDFRAPGTSGELPGLFPDVLLHWQPVL